MHIVIIGNGISGITAARFIRKLSDHNITVVSAETDYFFSRTALMYIYMGHMKYEHTKPYEDWFWKKNRIELKRGRVSSINSERKTLSLEDQSEMSYDKLIIATGSKSNKFGWPGQDLDGVQGLYSFQDLQQLEKTAPNNNVCKRGVIVGGGLIGIELAEMLHTRNIPVTFLVRENSFWNGVLPAGESAMLNRHILSHHIDLRLGVNLEKINGNDAGHAESIIIKETQEQIQCDLVGLTAGVSPNIELIKSSAIESGKGVLVNRYLETNVEDIYAIGDCAQQHESIGNRRPVEAVWYTGRIMGETVAHTICGERTAYNPGHWFNSAKFFDIEYQTYGWVFAKPRDDEKHFHWIHEDDDKCITICTEESTGKFLGINTFGIRMRQEVFHQWLDEERSTDYIISNLRKANFDPEFYKSFEQDIQAAYRNSN